MPRPAVDLDSLLHHAAWLQRLVEPLLASKEDAEDALHETWLAALERPPRAHWNLPAWLARVAGNRARRMQRDARRRPARDAQAARPESTASAEDIAARVEMETKLAQLVLELEPNPQRAILLRYYEGLPPREISSRLGVPVGTVKSWLHRGLERLRAQLAVELGADWRNAIAPLAPLGSLALSTATSVSASSWLVGSAVMQVKVAAGLAVLVGLCAWGLWTWSDTKLADDLRSSEPNPASGPLEAATSTASIDSTAAARVERVELDADAANPIVPTGDAAASAREEFVVQVLDHSGTPRPDAEVLLCSDAWLGLGKAGTHLGSGFSHPYRSSAGDPEAWIRVPRVDIAKLLELDRRLVAEFPEPMTKEHSLACSVIGTASPRHVLKDDVPPAEPIRLQLPPTGSVRVEVVDAAGRAFLESVSVVLRGESLSSSSIRFAKAGHATFPFVALNLSLEVKVIDSAQRLAPRIVRVDGPIELDQIVTVRVALEGAMPTLRGRLVDPVGMPISSRTIRFSACVENSNMGTRFETDALGSFALPWDHNRPRNKAYERFEFALLALGSNDTVESFGVVPGRSIAEVGDVDLGTIVLSPRERGTLLAAGVVVDGDGKPIAGAALNFYAVWPIAPRGPWEEMRHIGEGVPAASDERGRFRAESTSPARGVRVDARLAGYYAARPVVCERGSEDLELVLHRGAELAGTVQLDPLVDPSAVVVRFLDEKRIHAETSPDSRGAFRLAGLRPGVGALEVGVRNWRLLRIESIAIEGVETVRDARIESIDLRGLLRCWRVRIADVAAAGIERSSCLFGDTIDPGAIVFAEVDGEGRAAPWLPARAESVRLAAEGRKPVVLSWTVEEQTVRLEPSLCVAIELPPESAPPEGHALRVAVKFPPSSPSTYFEQRLASTRWTELATGQATQLHVPAPGAYLLSWALRSKLRNQTVELAEQEIVVSGETAEQLFRIGPPKDEIAAAVERLR